MLDSPVGKYQKYIVEAFYKSFRLVLSQRKTNKHGKDLNKIGVVL